MKINWINKKTNLIRHGSLHNSTCFVWNNNYLYMKTDEIGKSLNLTSGILVQFNAEDMVQLVECEINVLKEVNNTNG